MFHFTIRDVENLSGIKAHTLRMWEQRHGLCLCKRKESLHRYYDNDDLKHILRIAYLYRNGYKISKIAQFSPDEIVQLASKKLGNDEYDVLVNQLVEACLEYNEQQFENALHGALKSMGLEKSIEKVVYPFLDKIGLLWMTGHVLPGQEHFCSQIIIKKIIAAINALPSVPVNAGARRFLLFTPQGEYHEMPLLLIQYLLKKKGIKTILMGKNIATDIIKYYCDRQPVSHLYFHLITNFTNCQADLYLSKLSKLFADKQIIASGPAIKDAENIPGNVQILHSLAEVMAFDFAG
jgi:MerR family transcriptional regulator, light-induced transcriptional regulator